MLADQDPEAAKDLKVARSATWEDDLTYQPAHKAFSRLAAKYPHDLGLHSEYADFLVMFDKDEWALELYNKVLRAAPNTIAALRGRADLLLRDKKRKAAIADVSHLLSVAPNDEVGLDLQRRIEATAPIVLCGPSPWVHAVVEGLGVCPLPMSRRVVWDQDDKPMTAEQSAIWAEAHRLFRAGDFSGASSHTRLADDFPHSMLDFAFGQESDSKKWIGSSHLEFWRLVLAGEYDSAIVRAEDNLYPYNLECRGAVYFLTGKYGHTARDCALATYRKHSVLVPVLQGHLASIDGDDEAAASAYRRASKAAPALRKKEPKLAMLVRAVCNLGLARIAKRQGARYSREAKSAERDFAELNYTAAADEARALLANPG